MSTTSDGAALTPPAPEHPTPPGAAAGPADRARHWGAELVALACGEPGPGGGSRLVPHLRVLNPRAWERSRFALAGVALRELATALVAGNYAPRLNALPHADVGGNHRVAVALLRRAVEVAAEVPHRLADDIDGGDLGQLLRALVGSSAAAASLARVLDEVAAVAADAPARGEERKCSDWRRTEIIGALTGAGEPLQAKEIQRAIGLKRPGSLRRDLAYLVKDGVLVNHAGEGYTVADRPAPPCDGHI